MSTPDEALRQQLAEGLNVTGEVQAGVYGDPAGATAPPAELDISKAKPVEVDSAALLARLAKLEAAAAAAAPPVVEVPVDRTPQISSTVASDVREAFQQLHDRLAAVEDKLGL